MAKKVTIIDTKQLQAELKNYKETARHLLETIGVLALQKRKLKEQVVKLNNQLKMEKAFTNELVKQKEILEAASRHNLKNELGVKIAKSQKTKRPSAINGSIAPIHTVGWKKATRVPVD